MQMKGTAASRCVRMAVIILIGLGAGLLLMSCSGLSSPEKVVRSFLDELSGGDVSGAETLTADGSLNLDKKAAKLYKPLFRSIQYAIGGSVEEGDSASVSVTVTIINMEALAAEATSETLRHILSGEQDSDDYFYNVLLDKLEAPDAPTVTLSATVRLSRENGKWRINLSAPGGFTDAITGAMGQLIGY